MVGSPHKIRRTPNGLTLSQTYYEEKVFLKLSFSDSNVAKTPVDINHHMSIYRGEGVTQVEYARVIGSSMYLLNYIRTIVVFSISILSRYIIIRVIKIWRVLQEYCDRNV